MVVMMKLFAGLVAMLAAALAAVVFLSGRMPGTGTRPMTPLAIASPADSFVVHDAPPSAAPAMPASTPDPAPASGLDAVMERLRAQAAAKPDAAPPLVTAPPDTPAAPPPTPPPSPPQRWTAVTAQGARWRSVNEGAGASVVIDMGGDRVATVHVDPAFLALTQGAANDRVDYLKQTIRESFPPSATRFRFARDGSVSAIR